MPCTSPRFCFKPSALSRIHPEFDDRNNKLRFLRGVEGSSDPVFIDKARERYKSYFGDAYFELPCGQCLHCRLNYARTWAVRCMHESQMHDDSIFLTLTYSPENLPEHGFLDREAVPFFIGRLRREIGHDRLKYFHCGEYGDKLSRPHYHVLIFGWRPRDAKLFRRGKFPLYTSDTLERLWPHGFCPFGELSFESASYTARYATKKITGRKADAHYFSHADPDTGECFYKPKEYATMSNRGGLGRSWLEKYMDEVYPSDAVLVNGYLVNPPRFYDKILEKHNPELFVQVKKQRLQNLADRPIITVSQLADYRKHLQSKFDNLMRSIE